MYHFRQGIADLPELCNLAGMQYIVISPGSRNVPIVKSFALYKKIEIISVIDERVAGYVALGIALKTQKPVGLLCTSGTAALNYGPAIAEAFYQKLPLIAITADRPAEWIDQADGQTIRQQHIFMNHVVNSVQLPASTETKDDLWFFHRAVSESLQMAIIKKGPVQINIPLKEPVYADLPTISDNVGFISCENTTPLSAIIPDQLKDQWQKATKKMIVLGYNFSETDFQQPLESFTFDPSVIIFAENLSNTTNKQFIENHDLVIHKLQNSNEDFIPEILVHIGSNVLSKKLKIWLRNNSPKMSWRVSAENDFTDTFQCLTSSIKSDETVFLKELAGLPHKDSNYKEKWLNKKKEANNKLSKQLTTIPFCDLQIFSTLLPLLPSGSNLHLGNSTPVRYAQLFESRRDICYYSNRGTSGIDGCMSTMAGFALADQKLSTLIIGDVAFYYDSNALALLQSTPNARVIVINNGGGDIFRIIEKNEHNEGFRQLLTTTPKTEVNKLVEANKLNYFYCNTLSELNDILPRFFEQSAEASVLEIDSGHAENATYFKQLFE